MDALLIINSLLDRIIGASCFASVPIGSPSLKEHAKARTRIRPRLQPPSSPHHPQTWLGAHGHGDDVEHHRCDRRLLLRISCCFETEALPCCLPRLRPCFSSAELKGKGRRKNRVPSSRRPQSAHRPSPATASGMPHTSTRRPMSLLRPSAPPQRCCIP